MRHFRCPTCLVEWSGELADAACWACGQQGHLSAPSSITHHTGPRDRGDVEPLNL